MVSSSNSQEPPQSTPEAFYASSLRRHYEIPANRWCVTSEDLDDFVHEVRKFHQKGAILNDPDPRTGAPNPLHDDPRIGPNIHAVNKYVIQPVTRDLAAGASWALMKHETGLPIDFFVTHNWQEGIYEFYHKVTMSWPPGLKHMWCCFLANPQAWTVGDLKQLLGSKPDLSDSPFAVALHAQTCRMMLVVPNATESIYVRLWCVEEARRSIDLQLPVWVATDCGIQHWPLQCTSVEEATRLVASNSMRRLSAWSLEDSEAKFNAETQLGASFTTVQNAHCTDPNDENRIRSSMQGQEHVIDAMIGDLASKGQWLPSRMSSKNTTSGAILLQPSLSQITEPDGEESVSGLGFLLGSAKLQSHREPAEKWCIEAGVFDTSELHDNLSSLADALSLKPLQRTRLQRAAQELNLSSQLSIRTTESSSPIPSPQGCSASSPDELEARALNRESSGSIRRW